MDLYLIEPINSNGGPWDPWYDKAFGFVVRAESPAHARELASTEAGEEGADAWRDENTSTCSRLTVDGEAGVILRDFASA